MIYNIKQSNHKGVGVFLFFVFLLINIYINISIKSCIYTMVKLREIYISKQSNEISPIKPKSVARIQAWIRRVFRNNDYVQVKRSKSAADGKNTN